MMLRAGALPALTISRHLVRCSSVSWTTYTLRMGFDLFCDVGCVPYGKHDQSIIQNITDHKALVKKVIIADMIGLWLVDAVFEAPSTYSGLRVLIGIYGYAFQIYGDFAGYTDIAIGSARLLGFELPTNFNRPYVATDLRDFWRRWHISLSTWLRDYLYIPLARIIHEHS